MDRTLGLLDAIPYLRAYAGQTFVVKAGKDAPETVVAEAAKVIENTQRDLNIALMNELSIIFTKLGIDTQAVLDGGLDMFIEASLKK